MARQRPFAKHDAHGARAAGEIHAPRGSVGGQDVVTVLDAGLGEIARPDHVGVVARDLRLERADR